MSGELDLFCDQCHNFLHKEERKNELVFFCPDCKIEKPIPKDRATRVFVSKEKEKNDFGISEDNLTSACEDVTNPRIAAKCKNKDCDSKIIIYKRQEGTMARIFICPKCKQTWIEER